MVITLHCICDYYSDAANFNKDLWILIGFINELCRMGVPLFFMISGFLMLRGDIPDVRIFYKHRLLRIGIPFLIYDVFYYIFFCLKNNKAISLSEFFSELINCGSAYHLWFIYSIFFLYLMIPFVKIIVDKISSKMLLMFLAVVTFQTTIKPFLNAISGGILYFYFTEDGVVGYLGYMLLGYILGSFEFAPRTQRLIYILGFVFFVTAPVVGMYSVTMRQNFLFDFFNGGYSINHYAEAAAVFLLCKNRINIGCSFLTLLSKLTFGAYFAHVFILELLKTIQIDTLPSIRIFIWMTLTTVLSFVWSFLESKLVNFFKKRKNFSAA